MATFLGEIFCKVDAKGRIILPSAFKKQMPADADDRFVVRKDIFVNCLVLFTMEDWNKQVELVRSNINPYNREHNMFQRNFFMGTAELTLDNNNRLLIPKRLLDQIGAEKDVVLAGQDGRIEIWPEDVYATLGMPADDFALLSERLFGNKFNESEN
jgi:MraZ protein